MIFNFDEFEGNNEASNSQEFLGGDIFNIEEMLSKSKPSKKLKLLNIDNKLCNKSLFDKLDLLEYSEDFDITGLDEADIIEFWSILLEREHDDDELQEMVNAQFKALGLPAPQYATIDGLKKRLLCGKFWKRAISKAHNRQDEHHRIIKGDVAEHKQVYASDPAVMQVAKRRIRNTKTMAESYAVSNEGDVISMTDIVEHSIANPSVRFAELMVKMRGFEDYARESGDINMFYTLTAPSKYHRYSLDVFNTRYDEGMSPRKAQRYLCRVWARIRARLARLDIKLYGVRVCEPHQDGCPHFHFSLFMKPEHVDTVNAEFRRYALEEDGHEYGADEHRFKIERVKTASAYIVKYISKNLGLSINEKDFDHVTYGQRVSTWASLWGIRQFQIIGGAPAGIWRELRKQREAVADETIEAARQAADQGDWAAYLKAMGGATVKRTALPLELVKTTVNAVGQALINQYGEMMERVIGICSATAELITRVKNWVIIHHVDSSLLKDQDIQELGLFLVELQNPWPGVNNCTLPSSGQILTEPNPQKNTGGSLEPLHDAHVGCYLKQREHIKGLIVANFQKIQADKAMEPFCVAHVEAFKRYQKRLWQINRRQDAHVRAYQNHLKRTSRAANDATIAPMGADTALLAA
jgi:hypothetical protein